MRAGAGWSLAQVGDERAVATLLIAITDSSKHVRQAAATALGSIGDPRAGPALTKALRDPEKHVRQAAAEAVGRLRPATGTPTARPDLSCSECGRPICTECMTPAAVGLRCPDHAGTARRVDAAARRPPHVRARNGRARRRSP